MRRWLVPAVFGAAAIGIGARAIESVHSSVAHPGGRVILIALYLGLRTGVALAFAVFTVGRAQPHKRSRRPLALIACMVAMGTVISFQPPDAATASGLVLAGDALAVLSCVWLLAAVLTLGRCFGVLPEARGLVTAGPYRLVRHPVYLGELGACSGLALASPSLFNAAILAIFLAAQIVRMGFEERALAAAFPDYAAYAAHTPRLLPLRLAAPRWPRLLLSPERTRDAG